MPHTYEGHVWHGGKVLLPLEQWDILIPICPPSLPHPGMSPGLSSFHLQKGNALIALRQHKEGPLEQNISMSLSLYSIGFVLENSSLVPLELF